MSNPEQMPEPKSTTGTATPISIPDSDEHNLSEKKNGLLSFTPPPAPDGGLQAWLQVLAAHLVLINTWGFMTSFGIFQPYYVAKLAESPSNISWVGSLEYFLVFFIGTFSGRAMDAGYLKVTIAVGLFLNVFGVFMTSFCTSYWQLLLAQGICSGLGNGLLFCPIIALISTYFSKKRTFAIALQASGAATGGMIFPAIAQSLLPRIGFSWTVRVMGFVMLFNAAMILVLVRERRDLPHKTGGPLIDWSAFKELPYTFFTIGTFLTLWGVYFAYYYVRPYAQDILYVDQYTSFSFLLLLNGIGILGRLVPAVISDRYLGPINTFIPTILLSGILLFAWIGIHSVDSMWAFVVIFGYFGAGVQSLFPASLSSLTTDMSKIGVRIGMVFSIVSVASLSGPPIAGALIQGAGGSYLHAQIFGGTVMVVGAAFIFGARTARHGLVLKKRM